MSHKLFREMLHGGEMLHLRLDAPPGNILDTQMIELLRQEIERAVEKPKLKCIQIGAAGRDFCYGASMAEHMPEQVGAMLGRFHGLLRQLFSAGVPSIAVVQGHCLGGGLELAACCSFIFATPQARFGQPEIQTGLFPPAASALLPWRIGGGPALDLCVSGRILDAAEALRMNLVNRVDPDPAEAAEQFFLESLAPRSASSLRFAERAVRESHARIFEERLASLERLYLEELMSTLDAREGIMAFLEKRPPRFVHR